MKRAGIVLHNSRVEAGEIGRRLAADLNARGVGLTALPVDAERLGEPVLPATPELFGHDLDLVFVLGGDGTMLAAARRLSGTGTPLLGVNLGRLGFLTEVERDEITNALDRVCADDFAVDERATIEGETTIGGETRPIWALNDVIVERRAPGRLVKLAVEIDGHPFCDFAADGLIVATPTGSTAYSFSAHGPVVSPALRCLVLTPVSAHMLFDRACVVGPTEDIAITVLPDPDVVALSLDGQENYELRPGDRVVLRTGGEAVRLARLSGAPFWSLVRSKFHLRGA